MLFHSICSKANAHLYTASIVDKIAAVIVIRAQASKAQGPIDFQRIIIFFF